MPTQIESALHGGTTKQMKYVAEEEGIKVKVLRKRIANGEVVILKNKKHKINPVGIGYGLKVKINANIGTSPVKSSLEDELKKLKVAIDVGADTVMDLSLGGDLDGIRQAIIKNSSVPVGTVPIYQAVIESSIEKLSLEKYLEVFEKHAEDGIDFATVHAGVTREALPLLEKRLMPCVSRGGSFLIEWMRKNNKQSFLYEHFDSILHIARKYDVTLSLGDGLRPGCIQDATDDAQIYELGVLGELVGKCKEAGVQVMVEGPGHIPLNEIEKNIKMEKKICKNAPFYVLGPLPCDIAAGYDHIAAAIGGALAGMHGADFLCYVTSKEHIGLPNAEDVREGVIATKISAHIADVAKGIGKGRNKKMASARANLDWNEMGKYVLDRKKFSQLLKEECKENPEISEYCSMCGKYCTEKRKK